MWSVFEEDLQVCKVSRWDGWDGWNFLRDSLKFGHFSKRSWEKGVACDISPLQTPFLASLV